MNTPNKANALKSVALLFAAGDLRRSAARMITMLTNNQHKEVFNESKKIIDFWASEAEESLHVAKHLFEKK